MRYVKRKMKKEGTTNLSILIIFFTILLASLLVYINVKYLAQRGAENSVKECFVIEKEKWTNKKTEKKYTADYPTHSSIGLNQALY